MRHDSTHYSEADRVIYFGYPVFFVGCADQQLDAVNGATAETHLTNLAALEKLLAFPRDVTMPFGLPAKKAAKDANADVPSCTSGHIYHAATEHQWRNTGDAQEDCDVPAVPGWQEMFETKAVSVLSARSRQHRPADFPRV